MKSSESTLLTVALFAGALLLFVAAFISSFEPQPEPHTRYWVGPRGNIRDDTARPMMQFECDEWFRRAEAASSVVTDGGRYPVSAWCGTEMRIFDKHTPKPSDELQLKDLARTDDCYVERSLRPGGPTFAVRVRCRDVGMLGALP